VATNQATQPAKPNAPWYVKALVLLHIFCITVWALPNPPDTIMEGKAKPYLTDNLLVWNAKYLKTQQPLAAYLFTTGVWQYWDMFAPNPAQTDIWCDAEIIYRDGTHKYYLYPRMFTLPIQNKYPQERYRKFYERVNEDKYSYLWPPFALRIAYLNDDPKNPPVTVRLTRHWLRIMPPGEPQQKEYNKYTYFEYVVDPHLLQKMRDARA
jgi:hypothetical protein